MTIIKEFSDGSILEYGPGRFDEWCVYLTSPNHLRHAPTDKQYFSRLKELSKTHGANNIYDSFVKIYDVTTDSLQISVLDKITYISNSYGKDSLEIDILFTTIYAGMVAEERKANAVLKKRIKRLGMHQLLIDDFTAYEAANFSWGKKVYQLKPECEKRGF